MDVYLGASKMFQVGEVDICSAKVKHVNHFMCENIAADVTHRRVVLADNYLPTLPQNTTYSYKRQLLHFMQTISLLFISLNHWT